MTYTETRSDLFFFILQNAPYGVRLQAEDGTITYINPKFTQITGYTSEDISHTTDWFQRAYPDPLLRQKVKTIWKKDIMLKHFGKSYIHPVITKDGLRKEIEFRLFILPGGQVVVFLVDVTTCKELETSIRESERRLADIINFLPDPTFVIDRQGQVIAWNHSIERMTGVPAAEVLGKGDYAYAIPFYGFKRPILIDHVLQTIPEFEQSYVAFRRDHLQIMGENICPAVNKGAGAYMRATAAPLYDTHGRKVGAIESIRDITEHKEVEASQARALGRFQVLYDLAIAMSPEQDLDANLQLIVDKTRELLDSDVAMLALKDAAKDALCMHTTSGVESKSLKNLELSTTEGLGGIVFTQHKHGGLFLGEYQSSLAISHVVDDIVIEEGLVSVAAVRVSIGKQHFGILYAGNRYCTDFAQEDLDALNLIGNIAAVELTRKRAEASLRESQQRLADIIEFLPDPTFVINNEGVVITWNRAIEEMTGVKAEVMLGKGDYAYALPIYGKRRPMLVDLLFKPDQEIEEKYFLIHRERNTILAEMDFSNDKGERQYFWGKSTALYDPHGNLVGAIETIRDVTEQRKAQIELQENCLKLKEILDGTVNALATMAEKRDPYTAGHQDRVAQLACAIGREMGLSPEKIEWLHIAGNLHDIGKMHIPTDILCRPGKLTRVEKMLVKTHAQAGYDIVSTIPFEAPVADIILQHHERLNGTGYPYGLSGEEIFTEARILGVADVVEAMASHRPYRPALGIGQALEEIKQNCGILYDPVVANTCLSLFKERKFSFS